MARLLILYGSQTGNSRMIAKELGEAAAARGYDAQVLGLEHFKTLDFEKERLLVCISSSTGNGDAPENAEKFFRYVKRKSTPAVFAATLASTVRSICLRVA